MSTGISGLAAIRGLFSNRNYAIYASGNSFSLIGIWVQRVGIGWLTWELTHSGFWLGLMGFADLFPVVLIGPFAGVFADRYDRRWVSGICQAVQTVQALVLWLLTIYGLINVELLFLLALIGGITIGFHQPSRLSMIHSLVRPENLNSAVAFNSAMFNLARFIGPAVAGILITTVGVAWAFAFNGISYVSMIVALFMLRLPPQQKPDRKKRGILGDVMDGARYAFSHPAIGPILLMLMALSVFCRPVIELLPGFADAIFHQGAAGLATLTSAIGIGAIIGAVMMAQRGTMTGLTNIAIYCVGLTGLMLIGFAATGIYWLGVAFMAGVGFMMVVASVATQTLVQTLVEDQMRGRVMSLWGLILRGAPAIGALIMGWLSGFLGLSWPVIGGGVLAILAALFMVSRRQQLIRLMEKDTPAAP